MQRCKKFKLLNAWDVIWHCVIMYLYHKVREYFVYRDGHGLGSMGIHLAQSLFQFQYTVDLKSRDSAHQITPLTKKSCKFVHGKGVK